MADAGGRLSRSGRGPPFVHGQTAGLADDGIRSGQGRGKASTATADRRTRAHRPLHDRFLCTTAAAALRLGQRSGRGDPRIRGKKKRNLSVPRKIHQRRRFRRIMRDAVNVWHERIVRARLAKIKLFLCGAPLSTLRGVRSLSTRGPYLDTGMRLARGKPQPRESSVQPVGWTILEDRNEAACATPQRTSPADLKSGSGAAVKWLEQQTPPSSSVVSFTGAPHGVPAFFRPSAGPAHRGYGAPAAGRALAARAGRGARARPAGPAPPRLPAGHRPAP